VQTVNAQSEWKNERTRQPARLLLLSIALGLAVLCASGCGAADCECPPLIEYSVPDQRRLASELDAAPLEATWPRYVADYAQLRAMTRACAR
jgi:hypothetical protein